MPLFVPCAGLNYPFSLRYPQALPLPQAFLFLLVVFDVRGDAVSVMARIFVVIQIDGVIPEVSDKIRGTAVDMGDESPFVDEYSKRKAIAGSILVGAVAAVAWQVVPVFFIELPDEVDVQNSGYFYFPRMRKVIEKGRAFAGNQTAGDIDDTGMLPVMVHISILSLCFLNARHPAVTGGCCP